MTKIQLFAFNTWTAATTFVVHSHLMFEGLLPYFEHTKAVPPTEGQRKFFHYAEAFLNSQKERCLLLLKGYAGTGKTTVLSALISYAKAQGLSVVVLAPTGRAAKVISGYSGFTAFTIHKYIYEQVHDKYGGFKVELKPNLLRHALFVVDEASMIAAEEDASSYSVTGSLLSDLLAFVFDRPGNKLILSGDTAQLPPVGSDKSYALQLSWLRLMHQLTAAEVELTEVVRQEDQSGVLKNATLLRKSITEDKNEFQFSLPAPDISPLSSYDLQDTMESAYGQYGRDGVMLITKSNKRANEYNKQIRARMLYFDAEICEDDYLMVVKNNYFWFTQNQVEGSFIANGDIIRVLRIRGTQEAFGLKFMDMRVELIDYGLELEVKICLDVLASESSALPAEKSQQLFEELKIFYAGETSKRAVMKKIKEDEFYNALQVKFAYAVTCHKSQGGQWPVVFVDQGYLPDDQVNTAYLRWLYTAITRSTERVYLLNFDERFVSPESY
ncbi:MAG TPA: AAA family ATPase [Luteibaculaceae bacterium]|nr:AAA family ATPase [Luteibaculaceae bacterium]